MMRPASVVLLAIVLLGAAQPAAAQLEPARERLGVRLGYIGATDLTNERFGGGGNITLYFSERVVPSVYVNIKIGALYLGDGATPDEPLLLPGINTQRDSDLRFLFFSIGPEFVYTLGARTLAYAAAGGGVYSVSVINDGTLTATGDFSDQHLGWNASFGTLIHLTGTLRVDVNATIHNVRTSPDTTDLLYVITDTDPNFQSVRGDEDPWLYQISLGLTLDLY